MPKRKTIFMSHAVKDAEDIVTPLTNLLALGAGVPPENIFQSSRGLLPNGKEFVGTILRELHSASLVVSIFSPEYLKSQFCLAEGGAARMRAMTRKQAEGLNFGLVVRPAKFRDVRGVFEGVQHDVIDKKLGLNKLKDRVRALGFNTNPAWEEHRDAFLKQINTPIEQRVAANLAKKISVHDVEFDHKGHLSDWPMKLRLYFRNGTDKDIVVRGWEWFEAEQDALREGGHGAVWQLEPPDGRWRDDVEEFPELHVPVSKAFRTWIGLRTAHTPVYLRRRQARKRLGKFSMPVTIDGHKTVREYRL